MTEENNTHNIRCGMVSIVGRPNVGKSTLLNLLVGEKVAIVSKVPQTTRNKVRGIYYDERGQIIFTDTPGLHKNKDRLGELMNRSAYETTQDTDCIIHVVDTRDAIGPDEEVIIKHLAQLKIPIILALNKVDLKPKHLDEYISVWEGIKGMPVTEMKDFTLLPISSKTGINSDKLLDIIFEYMPEGPLLYPKEMIIDVPEKMMVADIIREKLIHATRQEVPHAVAVVVEEIQPRKKKVVHIQALILVERETQKPIVIGKDGEVLKRVGSAAREELEKLFERKVFLNLYVKSKKHWRDDNNWLEEMGYQ